MKWKIDKIWISKEKDDFMQRNIHEPEVVLVTYRDAREIYFLHIFHFHCNVNKVEVLTDRLWTPYNEITNFQ